MTTEIDFEKMGGLIPAIVQDLSNGEVLMVGFMNREALLRTRHVVPVRLFGFFVGLGISLREVGEKFSCHIRWI